MLNSFPIISTKELANLLDLPNVSLIDIRPIEAYNGWELKFESRGGHIKGARSLPFSWTKYFDWMDMLEAKAIPKENELIIYGYDKVKAEQVAEMLGRAGYANIRIYLDFLQEWTQDETLAMDRLERYKHLVYADWVHELINGGRPPHYDNDDFVVVHAHYQNKSAFLSGHIPGSIDMDTLEMESAETWNRRSPEELRLIFRKYGIKANTTVVLYGKFMFPDNDDPFPGSAAGHIGAIRTAFIMMWAGVKDVRILNGGFQAWKDSGHQISVKDEIRVPVDDFGGDIPSCPELAVDIEEAKQMLKSGEAELVSVRSWSEFIGEVSGYNYIDKKGRIPGAIFGNCGTDAYHMENYRNLDHTMREFGEIAKIWKDNQITPDKHIAFYCGTGWRGSEAFMNAWLMGWPRVSVFDGGWFEWSNDPNNPYETGIPK